MKGTRALEHLIKRYDVKLYNSKASSQEEFIQRMKEAEVVVNVRAYSKFTEEVFKSCSSLKLLSVLGTGIDQIDLEAASKYNVLVTNTPGFAVVAVAEHALTLMLSVARQISLIDREVKEGKWPRGLMTQLYGKTLGIIGLGAIGGQLARISKGIGMKVISWDTFQPSKERAKEFGVEFVSLEDLLKEANVISIHLRLSSQTQNLIGRKEFSLMKPTAIIINTARGAIINREALLDALTSGKITGAGLDVFDKEPLPPDDPLLKLNNIVLTPYNPGMTPETIEKGAQIAVDNIINDLQGSPTNIANK
ncbi:3-phosphoglycerate dehydrogenase [Candidatus Atribacteria bacterium HGW-Atribacteria-1]|nr:MAG: 3-phosphoglycerate dehydrogenase [Candidatus Atribacteria bacterium HGW-Atribacteria-1]